MAIMDLVKSMSNYPEFHPLFTRKFPKSSNSLMDALKNLFKITSDFNNYVKLVYLFTSVYYIQIILPYILELGIIIINNILIVDLSIFRIIDKTSTKNKYDDIDAGLIFITTI